MGLFGWHKCGEPGCDAVLFVPLFDAPGQCNNGAEGGPSWGDYEAERAQWHVTPRGSGERCPAHKPAAKEGER